MLHLHVSVCINRCMKAETIMSVSDGDIKVIFYFFQMLCILRFCNKIEEKKQFSFSVGEYSLLLAFFLQSLGSLLVMNLHSRSFNANEGVCTSEY